MIETEAGKNLRNSIYYYYLLLIFYSGILFTKWKNVTLFIDWFYLIFHEVETIVIITYSFLAVFFHEL